jgi:hypothetical protein
VLLARPAARRVNHAVERHEPGVDQITHPLFPS